MDTLTSTPARTDLFRARPSGLLPAFLVALALHALVLAGVMFYRLSPPAPPGEQQITVDLSPLMTNAPTQAPAEQEMSQSAPPEIKPTEEPAEEPTQPPPAEIAEVKPDETEAVTAPTQAVIEPPNQVITSTAEQAEPLAPPPEAMTRSSVTPAALA